MMGNERLQYYIENISYWFTELQYDIKEGNPTEEAENKLKSYINEMKREVEGNKHVK